jgi:hypothetical protein
MKRLKSKLIQIKVILIDPKKEKSHKLIMMRDITQQAELHN